MNLFFLAKQDNKTRAIDLRVEVEVVGIECC